MEHLNKKEIEVEKLLQARKVLRQKAPLVHYMTSTVAMNDAANALLALGGRPITAEHPQDAPEITAVSGALSVSVANISDVRIESIPLCGKIAKEKGVPSIIDAVGVASSCLRRKTAEQFIKECRPAVIKGNISEILTLCGAGQSGSGTDADSRDVIDLNDRKTLSKKISLFKDYAAKTGAVLLVTGPVDLAVSATEAYAMENGSKEMSRVTGTGCVLSCITAACLSAAEPMEAVLLAVSIWNISGELADSSHGLGTYHIGLLDKLSLLTDEEIMERIKLKKIEI